MAVKAKFTGELEKIYRLIIAKYPILQVLSWEEKRVIRHLKEMVQKGFSDDHKFALWSITQDWTEDMPVSYTHLRAHET